MATANFDPGTIESLLNSAWAPEDHKELRLLVTGKTGEGKSTLVNGLLGEEVAKEGAGAERCTKQVAEYPAKLHGVPVTVFDSPGLQDATENEDEYIANMRKKCQNLSLVLYCTKMTNNRLKDEDKHAILKLTEAFGQRFWEYAVLVLTFANMENVSRRDDRDEDEGPEPDYDDEQGWKELEKKRFKGRLKKWKEGFYKFLTEEVGVQRDIVEKIPVVPAGDHRKSRENREPKRLPDCDDWFSEFWKACFLRVREMNLFCKINKNRIKFDETIPTDLYAADEDQQLTADEKKKLSEVFAKENEVEHIVQGSTLQLTDTCLVDGTYTETLQENLRKMKEAAYVKEQKEANRKEKEKIKKERERLVEECRKREKEREEEEYTRKREREREEEEYRRKRTEREREEEEHRRRQREREEHRRRQRERQEEESSSSYLSQWIVLFNPIDWIEILVEFLCRMLEEFVAAFIIAKFPIKCKTWFKSHLN